MSGHFSGSYRDDDITFLLELTELSPTPVAEKEALIQSGQAHYSEMLSEESPPSATHQHIYQQALAQSQHRLASETMRLTQALIEYFDQQPVVLVSLVRAGVPLGVMLHRALRRAGHPSYHYGVSIIRGRGIDQHALDTIERRHGSKQTVFVDGWTGKGAIFKELQQSLQQRAGYPEQPRLLTLADPCGLAWLSASYEDWLIPFSLLGANVSGLVSRSLWSTEGYHRCVLCQHLSPYDQSRVLVDQIDQLQAQLTLDDQPIAGHNTRRSLEQQQMSQAVLDTLQRRDQINDINRLKLGIAEATRAVMRRVPERIYVRHRQDPALALLQHLAQTRQIPLHAIGEALGPYRAATLIKQVL